MIKVRKLRYILLSATGFLSIVAIPIMAGTDASKLISELQLTAVHNYLQLWNLGDCEQSAQARTLISRSITDAVIVIRSASPDIAELDGKALESLCILHENLHILDYGNDKLTSELARDYIDSVDEEVRERIQRLQTSMKGQGCHITPENK